ncbi:hypothetical protein [Streptosporangium sp. NPDC051022]
MLPSQCLAFAFGLSMTGVPAPYGGIVAIREFRDHLRTEPAA